MNSAEKLRSLRDRIDVIDTELVKLFCERMRICESIGGLKSAGNMAVADEARETQVLDRAAEAADIVYRSESVALMRTVMDISKCIQRNRQ